MPIFRAGRKEDLNYRLASPISVPEKALNQICLEAACKLMIVKVVRNNQPRIALLKAKIAFPAW